MKVSSASCFFLELHVLELLNLLPQRPRTDFHCSEAGEKPSAFTGHKLPSRHISSKNQHRLKKIPVRCCCKTANLFQGNLN